jgi:NADH-quinone oxidoreductase subunit H
MNTAIVIAAVIKVALVLILVLTSMLFLLWTERRLSAMIQDRLGPMRAYFPLWGHRLAFKGLLQPLFDMIKSAWKEDFVPPRADKILHALAPILAVVPVVISFAVIPWGGTLYLDHAFSPIAASGPVSGAAIPLQIASLDAGVLLIFAMGGMGVVGASLAGYSSNNKFSLLGGLRAASQMVSYEVALGLSLVGCFLMYNSLRLEQMVQWQTDHVWGVVVQPHALVFFLAASTAEMKRIPFDAPEAESELAGGFILEYSSLKWLLFKMGEYFELVLSSLLIVVVFFGGYHLPGLTRSGIDLFGFKLPIVHAGVVAINFAVFILKCALVVWVQFIIRWTLPRFRFDQIIHLCWRYLLPLTLINICATAVVVLWLEG